MDDDLRKKAEDALDLSTWQKLRLWVALPVMKDILTRFWTDPKYAVSLFRFTAVAIAGGIVAGKIVLPAPYEAWAWSLAPWIAAVAAGTPAGQTNRSPEEIKQIAQDPSVQPKTAM